MCITSPRKASPMTESRRNKRKKSDDDNAESIALPNGADEKTDAQTCPTDRDVEAAQDSSGAPSRKKQRIKVASEAASSYSHVVASLQAAAGIAHANNMQAACQSATQGSVQGGLIAAVGIAALNGMMAYLMTSYSIQQLDKKHDDATENIREDIKGLKKDIGELGAKLDLLIAAAPAAQATPSTP